MARFFNNRDKSLWKAPGSLIFVGTQKLAHTSIDLINFIQETTIRIEEPEPKDLEECTNPATVSWLNVNGIHDPAVIQSLGEQFRLHVLIQEDILNSTQRPKFEVYENCLFIVLKMLIYDEGQNQIQTEQVSLVLMENCVISFQENIAGDVFEPLRERISRSNTKIRNSKSDYLAYALMDAIVDNYIFIIERYGEKIEKIEKDLIKRPDDKVVQEINHYKLEFNFLRKTIRPVRELILQYSKAESYLLDESTSPYLKDLLDHITHTFEAIETYQDMLKDQMETYQTNVSNRLSDIIRVLTLISVIFIPITFIAGVYGTNFEYFPELEYKFAYPVFWAVIIAVIVSMLLFFKHKRWI